MSGRWTLTTAVRPSRNVQACTWPIEAADSGSSSNEAKTSSTGAPRSSAIVSRSSSTGNGGTSSRHRRAEFASTSGNIPPELAMI